MEKLLIDSQGTVGYPVQVLSDALKLARLAWIAQYGEAALLTDADIHKGKSLANLSSGIIEWTERYNNDNFKVLFSEIPGNILVNQSPERVLYFKMDSILADSRGVCSMEHKTTKYSINSTNWTAQWFNSSQIHCYLYVIQSYAGALYSLDDIRGVIVNGMCFRSPTGKLGNEFVRTPIKRSATAIDSWLLDVNYWLERLENEFDKLSLENDDNEVMKAFPRNDSQCMSYGGCPYLSICPSRHNPLTHTHDNPPTGFKVDAWDPRRKSDGTS